jgi:hypothetical protein
MWQKKGPLSPGTTYRIGGDVAGNADPLGFTVDSFTTDSRVTLTKDGVFRAPPDFDYPDQDNSANTDYLTVNFQIENVPIPAAVWLFATGLISLAGLRRKFRGQLYCQPVIEGRSSISPAFFILSASHTVQKTN